MARKKARDDDFSLPVVGSLRVKLLLEALRPHVQSVGEVAAILGEALLALDASGRERLVASLAPEYGKALKRAWESVPSTQAGAPRTDAEITAAWTAAWKLWDQIVRSTNDLDGPYLQNTISYNTPDLNVADVVADLDEVAEQILPLIEPVVKKGLAPRFDMRKRITKSFDSIAADVDWVIRPEDALPIGPKTTEALLTWMRCDARERGQSDAEFREVVTKLVEDELPEDGGIELDPKALAAFMGKKKSRR
jgi:hypothetical protein